MDKWGTTIWLSRKHCGKKRNCSLWAISSFPTMFSKAVSCWCVKMSICGVKGLAAIADRANQDQTACIIICSLILTILLCLLFYFMIETYYYSGNSSFPLRVHYLKCSSYFARLFSQKRKMNCNHGHGIICVNAVQKLRYFANSLL